MTREEAKALLPIIKAFSEGKDIEYFDKSCNEWLIPNKPHFRDGIKYRIKPEPTYRPFANAEECWNEMLKHQPFGWIKDKEDGHYALLTRVGNGTSCSINGYNGWGFNGIRECFTFADGSVFGVKVEK